MKPALCLGTAQFGLSYGITNANGQVHELGVAQLLNQASTSGIRMVDTAQAYGDAEAVLGRNLPKGHAFRIISKLSAQSQTSFSKLDTVVWEKEFRRSCERLGQEALDALLLHAPADLRKPGSTYLEDWLLGLRNRGLVKRLGVSIYTSGDLEGVNPELLDLVQLPLSLFDQRLLQDGTVTRLRAKGTAIHGRSLYLQGLLLIPAVEWPNWVSSAMRNHHQNLEKLAQKRDYRLIDLALGFAKEQSDLEAVVVGLCSIEELEELERTWKMPSPWQEAEWKVWALQDSSLDPRRWPS
jgi:aryl-alcohol dehydrogenase-like predicted oxidoreductase